MEGVLTIPIKQLQGAPGGPIVGASPEDDVERLIVFLAVLSAFAEGEDCAVGRDSKRWYSEPTFPRSAAWERRNPVRVLPI